MTAQAGVLRRVIISETRMELLKAARLPAFTIPVLLFPAMFYVLFGILLGGQIGPTPMAAYLLGSYATFGVIGAALFGVGVSVAAERGQGWLLLKRATPMPPLAYFAAKGIMSILTGTVIFLLLASLAVVFGGVRLPAASWLLLFTVLALGAAPFCALGCLLGYTSGPTSAPAIANLIYLPMSFASGLWIPIEVLPDILQRVAPALPPYHLARLAHGIISGEAAGAAGHVVVLIACTAAFLAASIFAYRRDNDRTWG